MATSVVVPDNLSAYGFKKYETMGFKDRVVWSWEGPPKSGKTFWPLANCPGPILYQDIDLGAEDVADKIIKARGDIFLGSTPTGRYEYSDNIQNTKELIKANAATVWTPFVKDYYNALASSMKRGGIRSIIWDTGTDFWDLCLNYTQGKEVKLMPEERTTANNLFKRMIKAAYSHGANLIILHHMRPEFDNPKKLERMGHNRIHALVETVIQVAAKEQRDKSWEFDAEVTLCRRDQTLKGRQFNLGGIDDKGSYEGDSFASIAAVITNTEESNWK